MLLSDTADAGTQSALDAGVNPSATLDQAMTERFLLALP
jgi:hypothetical protein